MKNKITKEQKSLLKFKKIVCDKKDLIDPNDKCDWMDLSYGFFLALGHSPESADKLSLDVNYKYQYWLEKRSK